MFSLSRARVHTVTGAQKILTCLQIFQTWSKHHFPSFCSGLKHVQGNSPKIIDTYVPVPEAFESPFMIDDLGKRKFSSILIFVIYSTINIARNL